MSCPGGVGWQPRWFVLESGVLSYYISPEEVTQGSRRSYKAASCHINGMVLIV